MQKTILKQKLLAILIAGFAAIAPLSAQTIWNGTTTSNWTGIGTETNPYLITTAEQLAGIAAAVKAGNDFEGKYIKLANDLYLSDTNDTHANKPQWMPISSYDMTFVGGSEYIRHEYFKFRGTFDGDGHTVYNAYLSPEETNLDDWNDPFGPGILNTSGWNRGFFGYLDTGAVVKNLHLENATVTGAATLGGLVCINNGGTVSNCSYSGYVGGSLNRQLGCIAGGLVGDNRGIIENCYTTAIVIGVVAGGLVGESQKNCTIRNCHATGKVYGADGAGGLVLVNLGLIENCYATGDVETYYDGPSANILVATSGGLVGRNQGKITECYATGNVKSNIPAAGFVGCNDGGGWITDCWATGNITAEKAAGFAGNNGTDLSYYGSPASEGIIINCWCTGSTAGTWQPTWRRGFVWTGQSLTINCYYNSDTISSGDRNLVSDFRTTAFMQSQPFVDTLNMIAALFGTSTWQYNVGNYPTPTGTPATNLTDYLAGGDGSENNPYLIMTKAQLENFAIYTHKGYSFVDKHIKMGANIALNPPQSEWGVTPPTQWKPIGDLFIYNADGTSACTNPFKGTFDGGGYEISNLYIDNLNSHQGLFGYLKDFATIKNLGVVDVWIRAYNHIGILAAVCAGNNTAYNSATSTVTIKQCWTSGKVEAVFAGQVSGFIQEAGSGKLEIKNCYSTADLKTGYGAVGFIGTGKENCYFAGMLTASNYAYAFNNSNPLTNCFYDSKTPVINRNGNDIPKTTAYLQSKEFVNVLNYWVDETNEQGGEQYLYWVHNVGEYPKFTYSQLFIPPHNITYISNGGSHVTTQRTLDASKIEPPTIPTKADNVFAGWYSDAALTNLFDFDNEIISSDRTLYAKWMQPIIPNTSWYNQFATSFCISTKEQLAGFALLVNGVQGSIVANDFSGKTVKLCADILLNDTTDWQKWGTNNAFANLWTPIGNATQFKGTFDGDGYTVSGVYVNNTGVQGFFGHVGTGAEIKNIGLKSSYVEGVEYVGGLVGDNIGGNITNCYSEANVKAIRIVGGLVGWSNNTGASISNCYATGNVTGENSIGVTYAGGLVGMGGSNITKCYATGNVSGTGSYVGGLAGSGGNIIQCYATGNVSGAGYVGGLIGNGSSVTNCYAMGDVTGTSYVGGLMGQGSSVNNCYATGNVTGTGGLIGSGSAANSYYDSETTGKTGTPGTAKLTVEMKQKATFINWDFTDIWGRNNSINNGYPHLRWCDEEFVEDDVDVFPVTGVTLNKSTVLLPVSKTEQLTATVQPTNADNQEVTWNSSNPNVATVTDGEITALSTGTTTITVTTEDGSKTAICEVTVVPLVNAQTPSITGQPQETSYNQNESATALSVTASVTDGGTLSYQWYSNTENSNTGGTPTGTNSNNYIPSTATVGTLYYYVVVTNTNTNTTVNGTQTATATSNTATCEVSVIVPAELPYSFGFEDVAENRRWTMLNGTQTNKWYIGSVVSNSGDNALYISNNGITHTYTPGSNANSSYVYAYRVLNITTSGNHTVSFNWMAAGRSNRDLARVFLIPNDIPLEADNAYGMTTSNNTTPAGWIAVGSNLYNQTAWQHFSSTTISIPNTGLYKLVVFWKNTYNLSVSDPPAAVDNISIYATPIPVTGVILNKTATSLIVGETEQLTATIQPSNATNQNISWSSNNPTVATVLNGEITALSAGTTTITVTTQDGNKTASCEVTVIIPVTDITGVPETAIAGVPLALIGTVAPSNATNQSIIWSIADAGTTGASLTRSVVSINISNNITSAADVSNWTLNGVSWNSTDNGRLTFSTNSTTATLPAIIPEGATNLNVAISARFGDYIYLQTSPDGIVWSPNTNTSGSSNQFSGNSSITSSSKSMPDGTRYVRFQARNSGVSNDVHLISMTITGNAPTGDDYTLHTTAAGTATVKATIVNGIAAGTDYSKNFDIVVTTPVTGVALNKNTTTLAVGANEQLTATVQPSNATNQNVTWNSSNPSVVTVSNGLITALAFGTTTITVTTEDGNKTATCEVTVIVPVTGVTLNTNTISLIVGETEQLTATIQPSNATNQNVIWNSNNPNVATVNNGVVTAISAGTATITVTTEDGNKTATCEVTVIVPVTGVQLNITSQTLPVGNQLTLTATVLPVNATNQNVTWSSSNPSIASIDNGTVTANSTGTAFMTVKTQDGNYIAECRIVVNEETGITEISINNLISVYPNPAKDELTIESGELVIKNLEITDLSGRTLMSLPSPTSQINITNLPSGIYLIKITTDNGVIVKKIVKE